jgi:hypothetical protein
MSYNSYRTLFWSNRVSMIFLIMHAVLGADCKRPHHRCEPAAQVELRRLQHRAGSRRGQWSHPLVWLRSSCSCLYCLACMVTGSSLLMWLSLFVSLCSPQAIFKDPFRRGGNILVSVGYSSRFTFTLRGHETRARSKRVGEKKGDQKVLLIFFFCFP